MSHDRRPEGRSPWFARAPGRAAALTGFVAATYATALPIVVLVQAKSWSRWRRTDVLWLAACGLLLLSSVKHGVYDWNSLGVASAWLVHRVASEWAGDDEARRALGSGLRLGGAVLFLWGVAQVVGLGDARASGPPWFHHPNVLAHAWLPLVGLAVAVPVRLVPSGVVAVIALLAMATTGSRSGVLAGIVVVAGLLVGRRPPRRVVVPTVAVAIVAVVAAWIAPLPPWLDRLVGSWRPTIGAQAPVNLFVASEALDDAVRWAPLHVNVERTSGDGVVPASWRVVRTADAAWSRPQQTVVLDPGATYTWSVELRASDARWVPGLLGWGRDGENSAELRVALDGGVPAAFTSGRIDDVRVAAVPVADGWVRLGVTFTLMGDEPLPFGMGPNPDVSSARAGATVEVRAHQFERGLQPSVYEPTVAAPPRAADLARGEAMARLPLWRAAWQGFVDRPLFGWGYGAFGGYLVEHVGHVEPAGHPHNLWLHALFEGGLLGGLALILAVAALWSSGGRVARATLAGLLVANAFDVTLYASLVLMPMALLAGIEVPKGWSRGRR